MEQQPQEDMSLDKIPDETLADMSQAFFHIDRFLRTRAYMPEDFGVASHCINFVNHHLGASLAEIKRRGGEFQEDSGEQPSGE